MKTFKSVFSFTASATKPEKEPTKEKKPKVSQKKQPEKVQSKKRGRPSNAELAVKAREKRTAEVALRSELIERQKAAASGSLAITESVEYDDNDERVYPEYTTSFASKVKDPNWIPPWPIFMPGQRVFTEMYGIRYEGTIGQDSIESAMVRVNWDDGSSQCAAKMNLKPVVKPQKKVYKSLLKAPRKAKEQ